MKRIASAAYRLRIWRDTRGQDLIEYALIAGFIAIVGSAFIPGFTTSLGTIFSSIGSRLDSVAGNV